MSSSQRHPVSSLNSYFHHLTVSNSQQRLQGMGSQPQMSSFRSNRSAADSSRALSQADEHPKKFSHFYGNANRQQKINLSDHDEFNQSALGSYRGVKQPQNNQNLEEVSQGGMVKQAFVSLFQKIKTWGKRRDNVSTIPVSQLAGTTAGSFRGNRSGHLTIPGGLEHLNPGSSHHNMTASARGHKARRRWKKAKSILVAIIRWKKVQNEIQLYGTHNYDFTAPSLNKSAHDIFQQQAAYQQSLKEQEKTIRCLIHPNSRLKRYWNSFLIFLLLYVATLMPFRIAFVDKNEGFWFYFDIFIDMSFILDIFINMFSAYYDDENKLVTNRKRIFYGYVKSWLLLDLLASFPFQLFEVLMESQSSANYNEVLRLLRLPRLYRLMKITRVLKIINFIKRSTIIIRIQEYFQLNAGIMRLVTFLITVFVLIHVVACIWYFSAKFNDFDPDTWVVRYGVQDDSQGRQYLSAFYWAVSTVLTVGYGDINGKTNFEKILSLLWMMIGVGFYSFTIGTLTSVLGRIDSRSSQLKAKLEVIDVFCTEAKIQPRLKKEIKEALEYNSIRNCFSWIDKYAIFNELPPNLKCEIAMQIHGGAIGKLPFFQNKDHAFIGAIVPLLTPLKVVADDYIYRKNDHPYDIYFIVKGRVNFVMEVHELVFKSWPQGSYFGEIEIILQKKRLNTAKAADDCDLFTLNKKFYDTVIYNDYPEVDIQLRKISEEREKRIHETLSKANNILQKDGVTQNILQENIDQIQPPLFEPMKGNGLAPSSRKKKKQTLKLLKQISQVRKQVSQKDKFKEDNQYASQPKSGGSFTTSQAPGSRSQSDSGDSQGSEEYDIWGNKVEKSQGSLTEQDETQSRFTGTQRRGSTLRTDMSAFQSEKTDGQDSSQISSNNETLQGKINEESKSGRKSSGGFTEHLEDIPEVIVKKDSPKNTDPSPKEYPSPKAKRSFSIKPSRQLLTVDSGIGEFSLNINKVKNSKDIPKMSKRIKKIQKDIADNTSGQKHLEDKISAISTQLFDVVNVLKCISIKGGESIFARTESQRKASIVHKRLIENDEDEPLLNPVEEIKIEPVDSSFHYRPSGAQTGLLISKSAVGQAIQSHTLQIPQSQRVAKDKSGSAIESSIATISAVKDNSSVQPKSGGATPAAKDGIGSEDLEELDRDRSSIGSLISQNY